MKNITYANNQGNSAILFVIYWFCALAALLAWKGSAYSETASIRKYLGMTEPSASHRHFSLSAVEDSARQWLGGFDEALCNCTFRKPVTKWCYGRHA